MTALDPMAIGSALVGMGEKPNRAQIQDYLKNGGVNLDPVTTAWCAAYVNSSLAQAGYQGTGSNMARSFLNYGTEVSTPQRGDLAVFSRGDPNGPFGHVGFFDQLNPDGTVRVLGGNQSDAVNYADYDPAKLLGYRRPVPGDGAPAAPDLASMYANGAPGQPAAVPPAVPDASMGGLATLFMQNQQGRQRRREEEEAEEQARRVALFGGPLFG